MSGTVSYDVVIPTSGRSSLRALLDSLHAGEGSPPGRVVVVDDRDGRTDVAAVPDVPSELAPLVRVVYSRGRGPAAARNVGWRASRAEWVVFLDDDVVAPQRWKAELQRDLATLGPDVAGSQGRVVVPLAADRAPTDWERNTKALERARWATADMAYRRSALAEVGGFDERFPRAYREDADLALRVMRAGYRLVRGRRSISHPVRRADPWVSVRVQSGNADDALMRALHGRRWREAVGAPRGRRRMHLFTTAAAVAAGLGLVARRKPLAAAGVALWAGATAELSWRRIAPGPRTPQEVATMLVTSVVVPPSATYHSIAGVLRARRLARETGVR